MPAERIFKMKEVNEKEAQYRKMTETPVVKLILELSLPTTISMLRQGMGSVSTMALNRLAAPYGDAAIAALSVVARIFNFLYSVALGIAQGFQPVSSFNYGAKNIPGYGKHFCLPWDLVPVLCYASACWDLFSIKN